MGPPDADHVTVAAALHLERALGGWTLPEEAPGRAPHAPWPVSDVLAVLQAFVTAQPACCVRPGLVYDLKTERPG